MIELEAIYNLLNFLRLFAVHVSSESIRWRLVSYRLIQDKRSSTRHGLPAICYIIHRSPLTVQKIAYPRHTCLWHATILIRVIGGTCSCRCWTEDSLI